MVEAVQSRSAIAVGLLPRQQAEEFAPLPLGLQVHRLDDARDLDVALGLVLVDQAEGVQVGRIPLAGLRAGRLGGGAQPLFQLALQRAGKRRPLALERQRQRPRQLRRLAPGGGHTAQRLDPALVQGADQARQLAAQEVQVAEDQVGGCHGVRSVAWGAGSLQGP